MHVDKLLSVHSNQKLMETHNQVSFNYTSLIMIINVYTTKVKQLSMKVKAKTGLNGGQKYCGRSITQMAVT